ncbi:Hemopexin-like repeat [Vigna unguiculata]|uniref:Hemopexin-like repeat n=1 Tax=Vigna unguiculata TaxID=3917 RepID=A0A4D6LY20_VIGUN|nr:Hemopexin-like repeat [Vigna unguiculata]
MSNPAPYINAAFRSSREYEVYFFMKNKYVRLHYTPGRTDDEILTNLRLIRSGFPSLAGTPFAEPGIDCSFDTEANSAFRSTRGKEVYLFKGNEYCRIAYDSKKLVGTIRNIGDGFPVLKGTIFESGIDACFASHEESEAYLFKGDKYVRIKFTPGATHDTLVGDVRLILDGWPCLRGILPVN